MSSVIELYEHNQKAYDALLDMLGERDRACIIKPTGTGKFVIIAKMVQDNPDKRFLLLGTNDYMFNDQMANLAEIAPGFRTNQKYWFICKVCGRSYQTRVTITRKPVCAECQYKIGRSAKRKVVCVETGAVYKGISAAGRAIGRSAASVSHALKAGTCSGGYHWQYLDE